MYDARQLRIRIAIVLASSSMLAVPACVTVEGGASTQGGGMESGNTSGTCGGATAPATTTGTGLACEVAVTTSSTGDPGVGGAGGSGGEASTSGVGGSGGAINTSSGTFSSGSGRPFMVAGSARVAGVSQRGDWSPGDVELRAPALDVPARAALAEAWLADARMEHASVASFARFTLELLALGAPADLVAASQRASLDEIEHARLCFAIASRCDGRTLGPAALDLTGSLRGGSLAESAAHAAREGCIGETAAALMARAQLQHAEDAGVRGALARIAPDEEAHAELAWHFVAWAIAEGGEPVRAAVALAFEEGARELRSLRAERTTALDEATAHRFGRLTAEETDGIIASALDEVIAPCAALLLRAPAATESRAAEQPS